MQVNDDGGGVGDDADENIENVDDFGQGDELPKRFLQLIETAIAVVISVDDLLFWQTDECWQSLVLRKAGTPDEINSPLGASPDQAGHGAGAAVGVGALAGRTQPVHTQDQRLSARAENPV